MTKKLLLLLQLISYCAFAQNYDGEVISYEVDCRIKNNGNLFKKHSVKIRINNQHAEELTYVSVPFTKKNKVENLTARITDMKGTVIRRLKKDDIHTSTANRSFTFHDDNYFKWFQLRHNKYPYILHYSYENTYSEFISITMFDPVLDWRIPTKNAVLKITSPDDFKLNISDNIVASPTIKKEGTRIQYEWNVNYTNLVKKEIYSPNLSDQVPYIYVVPESFTYEKPGGTKNWVEYGNWACSLSENKNNLSEKERQKVRALIKNENDTLTIIKKLYHYLQDNTRYVNISLGKGGYVPHSASYVSKNKYGDCKALTNYMMSLLETAEIPSLCAYINAGKYSEDIVTDFPSPQFNHVFLCVPNGKDTIWLENTNDTNAFGYLGTFDQGKEVLIAKKDRSYIAKTPVLSVEDVLEKHEYIYDINNPDTLTISSTIKGEKFEVLKYITESSSEQASKDFVERNFIPYQDYELHQIEVKKAIRDSTFIKLNIMLNSKSILRKFGDDFILKLPKSFIKKLETPTTRKSSIQINYPENIEQVFLLKGIPLDIDLPTTPKRIISKYGSYERSFDIQGNNCFIKKKFNLLSGKYPIEEYPAFYKFIIEATKLDQEYITLN